MSVRAISRGLSLPFFFPFCQGEYAVPFVVLVVVVGRVLVGIPTTTKYYLVVARKCLVAPARKRKSRPIVGTFAFSCVYPG